MCVITEPSMVAECGHIWVGECRLDVGWLAQPSTTNTTYQQEQQQHSWDRYNCSAMGVSVEPSIVGWWVLYRRMAVWIASYVGYCSYRHHHKSPGWVGGVIVVRGGLLQQYY